MDIKFVELSLVFGIQDVVVPRFEKNVRSIDLAAWNSELIASINGNKASFLQVEYLSDYLDAQSLWQQLHYQLLSFLEHF